MNNYHRSRFGTGSNYPYGNTVQYSYNGLTQGLHKPRPRRLHDTRLTCPIVTDGQPSKKTEDHQLKDNLPPVRKRHREITGEMTTCATFVTVGTTTNAAEKEDRIHQSQTVETTPTVGTTMVEEIKGRRPGAVITSLQTLTRGRQGHKQTTKTQYPCQ